MGRCRGPVGTGRALEPFFLQLFVREEGTTPDFVASEVDALVAVLTVNPAPLERLFVLPIAFGQWKIAELAEGPVGLHETGKDLAVFGVNRARPAHGLIPERHALARINRGPVIAPTLEVVDVVSTGHQQG